MKAIILAAGIGSRLKARTETEPKCMVAVNGVKIIDNQIKALQQFNITDIIVVVGYKADMIKEHLTLTYGENSITVVENSVYKETNNMYSLYLAKSKLESKEFILLNGDVFFQATVIERLCNEKAENCIVCEKSLYNEESMKIQVENHRIMHISKQILSDEAFGCSMDIYKFSAQASNKLFDIITQIIEGDNERTQWTEVALEKLLHLEIFVPLSVREKWVEIDNLDDLALAERLFI